eukprot:258668-Amphidinium_carterae.1
MLDSTSMTSRHTLTQPTRRYGHSLKLPQIVSPPPPPKVPGNKKGGGTMFGPFGKFPKSLSLLGRPCALSTK